MGAFLGEMPASNHVTLHHDTPFPRFLQRGKGGTLHLLPLALYSYTIRRDPSLGCVRIDRCHTCNPFHGFRYGSKKTMRRQREFEPFRYPLAWSKERPWARPTS